MALAISGRQVIDGTGSQPIENGVVLIEGERIVAVGPPEEVNIPANAERIDLPDDTILPGLIDAHSHVVLRDSPSRATPAQQQEADMASLALRGARNVRDDLLSGVTTMRTMSDRNFVDVAVRRAIDEGEFAGPRLVVATRGIRSTHGWGSSGVVVDGVEEVRKAVRENLQYGADHTKLFLSSKAGPDPAKFQLGAFDLEPTLTREEIQVAVDETHRAGKPVAAHVLGGSALTWAVEAGVDSIEHGGYVSDGQLELLVNRGTWLVFTFGVLLDQTYLERLPAWSDRGYRQRALAYQVALRDFARRAIAAGARYTVGADGRHGRLGIELECLVDVGSTPMHALVAATANAAAVAGVRSLTGTIEPGKRADVIAVAGDPLDDVSVVSRTAMVMKDGVCLEIDLQQAPPSDEPERHDYTTNRSFGE